MAYIVFVHQLSVICLVLLVNRAQPEKFTALKNLEEILHAEHGIAHDLMNYIQSEEKRLEQLKRLAADYEEHSAEALENPERHLANPVNAYLLVKRFTSDWEDILNSLIKSNATEEFIGHLNAKAEYFPDQEDLSGAATALLRLQDTYQLATKKIATGDLQGVKKSPHLTASDSFELARVAYNQGDHYHSVLWMKQSLVTLDEEGDPKLERSTVLDYLSFSAYMQGNPRVALNLTIEWLRHEPDHVRAQNNKRYYEQMIEEEEIERRKKGDSGPFHKDAEFVNKKPADDYRSSEEFGVYEALCRGEETHKYPLKHQLTCQFKSHHPIFYIRPLREETMYFDPFIAVYHDLITDAEVEKVRELAGPRLARSVVYHEGVDTKLSAQDYRTSKNAWLRDEEDPLIKSVSLKSASLSNLTLDTVEEMQVVNYGIGGHYEPHYDFARPEELTTFTEQSGNRIATVIYYMSDVDAGGMTVFPAIGVKLYPRKGSCAVWYNLRRNGEGDYDTRHAACPVLTGSKWICNKWFHERGQEFNRPCGLEQLQ